MLPTAAHEMPLCDLDRLTLSVGALNMSVTDLDKQIGTLMSLILDQQKEISALVGQVRGHCN